MNQEQIKAEVEVNLLAAMKAIDLAVFNINRLPEFDRYDSERSTLLHSKGDLKRILNKHFDGLARSKRR